MHAPHTKNGNKNTKKYQKKKHTHAHKQKENKKYNNTQKNPTKTNKKKHNNKTTCLACDIPQLQLHRCTPNDQLLQREVDTDRGLMVPRKKIVYVSASQPSCSNAEKYCDSSGIIALH